MIDPTRVNAVPCRLFDKTGHYLETQHWGDEWVMSGRPLEFIDAPPLDIHAPIEVIANSHATVRRFTQAHRYVKGTRAVRLLGADYIEEGATIVLSPTVSWLPNAQ